MQYRRLNLTIAAMALSMIPAHAMDLSVRECRELALRTDENVRIAENAVAAAGLNRGVARTSYLPKLAGNASVVYSAPDTEFSGMSMQMRGMYLAGISITQPVYAGGKIRAANRMAKVGEEIAEEQLRAARMDVIAEAEKSYWMYVAVRAKVDMMEAYLSLMDSIYAITETSTEVGLSTRQSLLRVETRRSEVRYRLHQACAGADICRMALCRAIGVPDTTMIIPTETMDSPEGADPVLTSVDSRPELRMLVRNIDIKELDVKMARAEFLPAAGLQLGWSAYGNMKMKGFAMDPSGMPVPYSSEIKSNGFLGMLSVQVPLFHWGEGYKKVKSARLETENARLSLERNRRLMELEANQAYSNMLTGEDLVESARQAFAEAEENLRLMTEQYDVGLMKLTDLLEAQSQWHTSYSNLIEAQTQKRIYRIEYLRSVGEIE